MNLQIEAHENAGKDKDKYAAAATIINAGGRGFFGRLLSKEQRLQSKGALKIQCAYRGMLGRRRADDERWRKSAWHRPNMLLISCGCEAKLHWKGGTG